MSKSQYQHYIPRFILRNFALDDHLKHSKERHNIYYYDVKEGNVRIVDVDTAYGMTDMYADIQKPDDVNYIEFEISRLEQKASGIIKRLMDVSEMKIVISHAELEILQRFLFIMSFRFPGRRAQFKSESLNEFGLREVMAFMQAKGRSDTVEAWLETIKGALREDPRNLFNSPHLMESQTKDYWTRNKFCFFCIWEAEPPDEFVLTENGFGLWEGECGNFFTEHAYHYFYPLSPRRILVHAKVLFKPRFKDGEIAKIYRLIAAKFGLNEKGSLFPIGIHKDPYIEVSAKYKSCLLQGGISKIYHFHAESKSKANG